MSDDEEAHAALLRRLRPTSICSLVVEEDEDGLTLWAVSGKTRSEFCRVQFERAGHEDLDAEGKRDAARRDAQMLTNAWGDLGTLLEKALQPDKTERLRRDNRRLTKANDELEKANRELRDLRGARKSLQSAYKSLRVALEKSGGLD